MGPGGEVNNRLKGWFEGKSMGCQVRMQGWLEWQSTEVEAGLKGGLKWLLVGWTLGDEMKDRL
ncbi:hypothetical protein, partial [Bartonella bacilliformis]|uniref:hypothetical protein n=1 Tax=Bartonella bacilliformis TaxID=774 RepID=UPI001AEBB848